MLAQEYTKLDRSRPETCCLVGGLSFAISNTTRKTLTKLNRELLLD